MNHNTLPLLYIWGRVKSRILKIFASQIIFGKLFPAEGGLFWKTIKVKNSMFKPFIDPSPSKFLSKNRVNNKKFLFV